MQTHQRQDSRQWETTAGALLKGRDVFPDRIDGRPHAVAPHQPTQKEGRSADVAGANLHADMEDFNLLKMEGESVDIMCDVAQDYKKYVCYKNGKKVSFT
jgi:hypothetical protein